jgi:ABC-type nitrate/sulfonate/bicarbonate transport system substrate-binding protein
MDKNYARKCLSVALAASGILFAAVSATAQDAVPSVKIGWQRIPMLAASYLIGQNAKSHGLNVELIHFNRYSDMRVALENGSIDFGSFGPTDVNVVADAGEPNFVVIAGQAKGGDLIAKKAGMGPVTWDQVAAGKIPFGSFGGGIAWLKTVATMDEKGLDFGKVDEIKVAGTIQDVMQNVKVGKTQVTMNVDPAIAQAVVEGYAEYADELDINNSKLGGQNSLFAANKKILDKPAVLDAVLRAYVTETKRLQDDRDLWISTYQEYTGVERKVAELSLQRVHLDLTFSEDHLRNFSKFMYDKGLARKANLVDRIGKYYNYMPLSKITGKSPEELGKSKQ